MKLSDSTSISLPARNLLAILAAVAIGTMSYFSVIERLNKIETTLQLMEKDLEALNHQDEIEDPNKAINKDQLNLIQQQLVTLQGQLGGLESSVNENEENKTSLQDELKKMIPSGLPINTSDSLIGDNKEFKEKEEKYNQTKTALESKISLVQEQVNTMQHQINQMHQKQNKLDLEHDVEKMVNPEDEKSQEPGAVEADHDVLHVVDHNDEMIR